MPIWYLNPKLWASLAAAAALAWLGWWLHQTGYDSAMAERLEAQQAREAAIAEKFVQAVSTSERQRREALEQVDQLRRRPPVVITDVQTEIIERNVCRSFDAEFIGLLDAT
tara:strand:+ start:2786 stop:3118 length:333 start_codon:yes stop_codon:yes gene_type:complete